MDNRPGCLQGLIKLALLNWLFDFLQERFGFGRGCSCTGVGCGFILLILLIMLSCSVITGTIGSRFSRQVKAGAACRAPSGRSLTNSSRVFPGRSSGHG